MRGHLGALGVNRRRDLEKPLGDDGLHRGAGERLFAGQHLPEHESQTVLVTTPIDAAFSGRLLGAHVRRRSHRHAGRLAVGAGVFVYRGRHGTRDPEVEHHRVPGKHEDILRLHVAMQHVGGVGVVERVGDFPGNLDRVGHAESSVAIEPRADVFAVHEGHDVERDTVGGAGIEQRQDVRMREPGRQLDFAEEPFGAERGRHFGEHDLDGHQSIVLEVAREVHARHATYAKFTFDAVAIGEGLLKGRHVRTGSGRRHGGVRGAGRGAQGRESSKQRTVAGVAAWRNRVRRLG